MNSPSLYAVALATTFFWSNLFSANLPPTVNAGPDTTIRAKYAINVNGIINDEKPKDSLTILWTQLSPDSPQVIIKFSTRDTCNIVFGADTGTFTFELSASDGQFTRKDTMKVHVLPNLPFVVLAPVSGEHIQIGKPYIIKWQMDPPAKCRVAYLYGTKDNLVEIVVGGGVNVISEVTWAVDPTLDTLLKPGTPLKIRVTRYGSSISTESIPFTLVATGIHQKLQVNKLGIKETPRKGTFTVSGRATKSQKKLQGILVDGKALKASGIFRFIPQQLHY